MRRRQLTLALGAPLLAGALAGLGACATPATDGAGLWFIFLESGRPTPDDRDAVMAMQRGHIDNFKRLFGEGKLLAAGPMADPARSKRGLVVVRAASHAELMGYFQPDAYVREGYMQVNAVPALARRAVYTEGIDATRVEEIRIVLIGRPAAAPDAATAHARQALLQGLVERGNVGAWYTLQTGPVAEVLLARGTDSASLEAALAPYAAPDRGITVQVWRQWISPGVVGPR
ncbi:MAG: hypothetical protein Q7U26_16925 [Aquabacterium sp.]|nr:hypothetical protein [Aquabacterium sp.]